MNLEKLEEKKERNKKQRREFVKYWVEYIKEHSDEEWSRQQNLIIDSQISAEERDQLKRL